MALLSSLIPLRQILQTVPTPASAPLRTEPAPCLSVWQSAVVGKRCRHGSGSGDSLQSGLQPSDLVAVHGCPRRLNSMAWDLCMQAGHQTQAFRLVQFFDDPLIRARQFPGSHFAAAARELGPRTDHAGPSLVLFTNLELEPDVVLRWFTSPQCLIRRHVTRLYWLPQRPDDRPCSGPHECTDQLRAPPCEAPQPSGVESAITMQHHAAAHAQGEQATAACRPAPSSREQLLSDISNSNTAVPADMVLRLQCRPKALEEYLEVHLPTSFQLHPSAFTHVLQCVEADGWVRWSVVPSSWLYRQSKDEEKALPDSVAHAVNKLDEALLVSGLRFSGRLHAAIDVGAAPGAWSMYLADVTDLVLAVDPAQLHPDALRHNIVHVCKKAEDAGEDITRLLAGNQADILTCDMNIHPTRSSQMICSLLDFLKPGGIVILTLKFMGTGRDRGKTERYLRDLYAGVLEDGRMVWLLANTVNEQTWIAVKCGAIGSERLNIVHG